MNIPRPGPLPLRRERALFEIKAETRGLGSFGHVRAPAPRSPMHVCVCVCTSVCTRAFACPRGIVFFAGRTTPLLWPRAALHPSLLTTLLSYAHDSELGSSLDRRLARVTGIRQPSFFTPVFLAGRVWSPPPPPVWLCIGWVFALRVVISAGREILKGEGIRCFNWHAVAFWTFLYMVGFHVFRLGKW